MAGAPGGPSPSYGGGGNSNGVGGGHNVYGTFANDQGDMIDVENQKFMGGGNMNATQSDSLLRAGVSSGGGGNRTLNKPYHSSSNSNHSSMNRHQHSPFRSTIEFIKLGILFGLWYLLNVLYNIDNKHTLTMLPLPWTVSTVQLFVGWVFFIGAWVTGLRPIPYCHSRETFFSAIAPQGICHLMVHIGAVISLGAGAVSFTHIVKAGEPVLTAMMSGLFLGQIFSWQTYISLIPVVFGVGLASATELSFTWMSFCCAMISNLGSSSRSILAKKVMSDKNAVGTNLTSPNMYALLTIVASIIAVPLALIFEGSIALDTWRAVTGGDNLLGGGGDSGGVSDSDGDPHLSGFEGSDEIISPMPIYTPSQILFKLVCSGIWYYTYNEVAYLCLEKVNQVSHAVANTLKRVVIIVAAIVVFRTPVTLVGSVGSGVAIFGTLLYSLSKAKYG